MLLFVWTATTGLNPVNNEIVKLSYILKSNSQTFRDTLIFKTDIQIRNHLFHGITNEISQLCGRPFYEFINTISQYNISAIISHNLKFHLDFIKSNMIKYDVYSNIFDSMEKICTASDCYFPLNVLYNSIFNTNVGQSFDTEINVNRVYEIYFSKTD